MSKRSILIVPLLLLLASCNLMQGNSVEVTNQSAKTLNDLSFAFADDSFERLSLAPGETWAFSPDPDHDGGILLFYTVDNEKSDHELGYAAPPISMTCKFEVVDDEVRGDCEQN